MKIIRVKDSVVQENPHKIESKKLYDYDHAQVMHLTLQAGESLKPHITPTDVFFYILEGSPEILVGEERVSVDAEALVESPKDIVHCIYNNTQSVVRVLVVKTPRPTSLTKFV